MQAPTTSKTATTIASWAWLVARTLDSYGVDSLALFAEAGIDLEAARDPNARIPVANMSQVWQLAVRATGDPCVALRAPEFFQPGMYGALGVSLMSSNTMEDFLHRAIRYHHLTSDAVCLRLVEKGDYCELIYALPTGTHHVAGEALEAFVATGLTLNRLLTGMDGVPEAVYFHHDKRDEAVQRYRDFFGTEVFFAAPETKVVFSRQQLTQPCLAPNPAIAATLDSWMRDYLRGLQDSTLASRVQAYLAEHLASGVISQARLAADLGMSLRALQRRLQQEGHSYQSLLDSTRRELAVDYLARSNVNLAELTYLLGFSDQSNFSRAFRRWTGCSPRQYHNQQLR